MKIVKMIDRARAREISAKMLRVIMRLMLSDIPHDEAIETVADCIQEITTQEVGG